MFPEPEHQPAAVGFLLPELFIMGMPQETRRQHGREGERNEQRDHDGEGHGDAVAGEEPGHPALHEGERQENHHQRERGGEHGQRDFAGADDRGLHGSHAPFLHGTMHVLQHDNGVVDDNADGEDQAEHGEVVEREVHHPHEREGRDDRGGDGHAGDDRAAPVMQEKEDREGHEDRTEQQVEADFVQRAFDEDRLVARDGHGEVRRHLGLQFLQLRLHPVDDRHRVDTGLLAHDDRDGVLAVEPRQRTRLLHAVADRRDIAQVNGLPAGIADDQLVEIRHRRHAPQGAYHQFARTLLDPALRQFQILLLQGLPHIVNRQSARPQPVDVHPDLHRAGASAHDGDRADIQHGFEVLLEDLVRDVGDLAELARRAQADGHDRHRIQIELADDGRFRAVRELRKHRADLVAHILCGRIPAALEEKLDGDL